LLGEIDPQAGESVLEAGCGTARNLIILGRRQPDAKLFGLDASSAMLETAQSKIDSSEVKNITLKTALADDFTFDETFGLAEPFDKIFFSYSISMIPPWRESVGNALANLKQGGELFIVDFYDQANLPGPFRKFLKWWLTKFRVKFWPELMPHLRSLEENGVVLLHIQPLFRRYSFIARMKKL
jgi:S-adenosylmethionine-diacylgycerolhomoserine-N-methlytransferase